MPCFKITLAYDGAEFSGWQAQPDRRTVQGEFERAWGEITGEAVRVTASGRTDAGVHAAGQVVGVESATRIEPEALVLALNAKLPDDVAVRDVELAPDGFHATTDAKRKRYRYTIYNDRRRPVFWRRYAWHVPTPLDVAAMHRGAQHLVGTHDFVSFQSAGSERESTIRTLFAADVASAGGTPKSSRGVVEALTGTPRPAADLGRATLSVQPVVDSLTEESAALVTIEIEGDGFLYNMVRSIAGTLAEVGRGKREPAWVADVLAAKDRTQAGQTAPPHGLALLRVEY
jgi:tRNA pseudouridine38-40 synthase